MEIDLAGVLDGISERFVPNRDPGRLIEVEHLARYIWAATFARDRRVLDAGCGSGYGCRLLAAEQAARVTGVDIAQTVLDSVAPTMPENVTLRAGDVRALEFEDDSFDLVVCFEVIEHVADPFPVLDELARVLAPGGLLLVSSPNRGVYQDGNPHHLHEFQAEELREALRERLPQVALMRQSDYIASALLGDEAFAAQEGRQLPDVALRKIVTAAPGEEVYTIGMASSRPLPQPEQLALMTGMLEMREWLSVFDTQTAAIDDKDAYIAELETRLVDSQRLGDLLLDSEQRLSTIPDLQLRITDLDHALRETQSTLRSARDEALALDHRLMESEQALVDVLASPSWQITQPLRVIKKLLRR